MIDDKLAYRIMDLAGSERLATLGPQSLSNAELNAILLHVGVTGESAVQVGKRFLDTFGGLPGLHKAPFEEVCDQHGIGLAKTCQIKAAVEIGRRLAANPDERSPISSPNDAADLVRYEMNELEQEDLRVILLNTRNRVVKINTVYRGSLNSSQVRVGEVFKDAIRRNVAAIIVVHNYHSGDPTPSSVIWLSRGRSSNPGNC